MLEDHLLDKLTRYFKQRTDIAFAFLFGSPANGAATARSDVDVAVYFFPSQRQPVEFEADLTYDGESALWADVEGIVKKEVDLVVLNRVPATVAAAALLGHALIIKDKGLYLDFMTAVTDEADSFMDYIIRDYREKYALQ